MIVIFVYVWDPPLPQINDKNIGEANGAMSPLLIGE